MLYNPLRKKLYEKSLLTGTGFACFWNADNSKSLEMGRQHPCNTL
jgi:hypothetical protein